MTCMAVIMATGIVDMDNTIGKLSRVKWYVITYENRVESNGTIL